MLRLIKRYYRYIIVVAVILFFLSFVFPIGNNNNSKPTIAIGEVLRDAIAKPSPIQEIQLTNGQASLRIKYKNGEEKLAAREIGTVDFTTQLKNAGYDFLNGPNISVTEPSASGGILDILLALLPFLLFIGLVFFMWRQSQGANTTAFAFGKSRARRFEATKVTITFNDVAGVDEARQELAEIVEFLKFPAKFVELGARIPRGVLLIGAPGTGKTLMAKAVAGEAEVPYFSISGSEFVEMFVGVGASRVRDMFEQAKKEAPCIIFIDEIDAVGRRRGTGTGGGNDEREQTLNQILVEMDGFDSNTNIIIIAATNRPDVLDPALLRPGRFDRQVILERPDLGGRLAILKVHSAGKPLAKTVSLEVLAKQTSGFSGADLSNLINEAAILAARRNRSTISMSELEEAILRVVAGPARLSHILPPQEKIITAYHEVGHAIVARMLASVDPVHKISIIPRGRAGGLTMILPDDDYKLGTQGQLQDQITWSLGGRVAEELIFAEVSSGASNDIEQATEIARTMVTRYGMSQKLGPVSFSTGEQLTFLGGGFGDSPNYSSQLAYEIDCEIRAIINKAYQKAQAILSQYRLKLVEIAEVLLVKETLEGVEFEQMFDSVRPVPLPLFRVAN